MPLPAGLLRHRITLQRQDQQRDADGGVAVEWQTVATVWAAIEPLSAREFIAGQALASDVDTRLTIRHRADVAADWRALQGDRIYAIRGVLADKDSGLEYLTLPCSSGVSDGA